MFRKGLESMRRLAIVMVAAVASVFSVVAQAQDTPVVTAPEVSATTLTPAVEDALFPEGARHAYIDVQRIAAESALGLAANSQVLALQQQRVNELNQRNQALQASQQKLDAGAGVLSVQAVTQLQREIERQTVDLQRFTEDAQIEVQALQEQLFSDFELRLSPVIEQVFEARGLLMLFDAAATGLILANPGLDLTVDVIQQFDQANPAPTTPAAP
jgi:Skp family chaperone for outer membrane proteins